MITIHTLEGRNPLRPVARQGSAACVGCGGGIGVGVDKALDTLAPAFGQNSALTSALRRLYDHVHLFKVATGTSADRGRLS